MRKRLSADKGHGTENILQFRIGRQGFRLIVVVRRFHQRDKQITVCVFRDRKCKADVIAGPIAYPGEAAIGNIAEITVLGSEFGPKTGKVLAGVVGAVFKLHGKGLSARKSSSATV